MRQQNCEHCVNISVFYKKSYNRTTYECYFAVNIKFFKSVMLIILSIFLIHFCKLDCYNGNPYGLSFNKVYYKLNTNMATPISSILPYMYKLR